MAPTIRTATESDLDDLTRMNARLIVDQRHRNAMSALELRERMVRFLVDGYVAVLAEIKGEIAGYLLYRLETEVTYIRQLYGADAFRRRGIGAALVEWVVTHHHGGAPRLRMDVLIDNRPAIEFWRAIGFQDYMLTLERELGDRSGPSD